ncbi:hypothetical protein HDU97_008422 [Phlyctochytrium planicorne]|nr:hypothetical protein HDU97_008422 [Phlyctochytrium planicorne]
MLAEGRYVGLEKEIPHSCFAAKGCFFIANKRIQKAEAEQPFVDNFGNTSSEYRSEEVKNLFSEMAHWSYAYSNSDLRS